MRVAIIHDWLVGMRGGEKCLEEICALLPECEIFTLFHQAEQLSAQLRGVRTQSSFLNRLPSVAKYYRYLLPLYPLAAKNLSAQIARRHVSEPFDLMISISHCAAKNVAAPRGVPHVCYCLTPVRYFWDQYERYFAHHPLEPLIRLVLQPLRRWDVNGARHVDYFVAISEFIRDRIRRYYSADAAVVYPPVPTEELKPREPIGDGSGFLVVNALVPYKNTSLIVEAFNRLGFPLRIVGTGPEEKRLKSIARPNIEFLGRVESSRLAELYRTSEALVFAAEEDFGITPVEMLASGRPVIAFGRGGALETVAGFREPGAIAQTGLFFNELSVGAIEEAVLAFRKIAGKFTLQTNIESASRFSREAFHERFAAVLDEIGREVQRSRNRVVNE